MKIDEAASTVYGVSKQYLYRTLKKKGIPVDSLREELSGEISEEGWVILDKHFTRKDKSNVPDAAPIPVADAADPEELERCRADLRQAQAALIEAKEKLAQSETDNQVLRAKLEGAEAVIRAKDEAAASTKQQIERMEKDIDYLKGALAAAQQSHIITMAKLPAPSEGNWFTNLFKPKKAKQPKDQQPEQKKADQVDAQPVEGEVK